MLARPSRAVRHAVLAAALAAGLALTGCGSKGSGGDVPMRTEGFAENQKTQAATQGLYDFTPKSPRQAEGKLTFVLPKALMDQLPDVKPMVTKVEITAHPLKSMEYCAMDVKLTYADDISQDVIKDSFYFDKTAFPRTGNSWHFGGDKPLSAFDETAPKWGDFMSDDYTNFIEVRSCASGPADSNSSAAFVMTIPSLRTNDKERWGFATMELTSMKSGTLFVRKGEIINYRLDSNGTWIKK